MIYFVFKLRFKVKLNQIHEKALSIAHKNNVLLLENLSTKPFKLHQKVYSLFILKFLGLLFSAREYNDLSMLWSKWVFFTFLAWKRPREIFKNCLWAVQLWASNLSVENLHFIWLSKTVIKMYESYYLATMLM